MHPYLFPGAVGLVCVFLSEASAQSSVDILAEEWLNRRLLYSVRPGYDWPKVQQHMLGLFLSVDREGNGVSSVSYEHDRLREKASFATGLIGSKLRMDLNNDGDVSREEVVTSLAVMASRLEASPDRRNRVYPSPEKRLAKLSELVKGAMKDDLDGDGVISFSEIRASADATMNQKHFHLFSIRVLLPGGLDRDGDGVITSVEWNDAVRSAFQKIDTDGNEELSREEIQIARQ